MYVSWHDVAYNALPGWGRGWNWISFQTHKENTRQSWNENLINVSRLSRKCTFLPLVLCIRIFSTDVLAQIFFFLAQICYCLNWILFMALQRPTFNSQIHTYLPQETMVWHFQVFFPLKSRDMRWLSFQLVRKSSLEWCFVIPYTFFCPVSLIVYCFNQNSLWTIHYGISNISTDFCPSDRT